MHELYINIRYNIIAFCMNYIKYLYFAIYKLQKRILIYFAIFSLIRIGSISIPLLKDTFGLIFSKNFRSLFHCLPNADIRFFDFLGHFFIVNLFSYYIIIIKYSTIFCICSLSIIILSFCTKTGFFLFFLFFLFIPIPAQDPY